MSKKVIVVGAGFTGMSVAAYLAANGFEVEVFEKYEQPGGRARHFTTEGFTFDMGPSLYCFTEVIDKFFSNFHHSSDDFFSVKTVNPINRIYFSNNNFIDIPSQSLELKKLFQSLEKNGDIKLDKYIDRARVYYNSYLQKITDRFPKVKPDIKRGMPFVSQWLNVHRRHINKLFRNPITITILNNLLPYPGLFPNKKSIINYAINYSILNYGPGFPVGGIFQLVNAFQQILQELKVLVYYGSTVESYDIIDKKITGIITNGKTFHADIFVSSVDYHHTEQIIPKDCRNYSGKYWKKENKMPSVLIYYLGIDKKISNLKPVNTILRNRDLNTLFSGAPLYVISPSKLDKSFAPEGKESLIIRIVIPKGIEDTGKMREHYYEQTLKYLEQITGENIQDYVIYKKSYAKADFEEDYNTYRGKAFGWLNTLYFFRDPNLKIRNQHLPNLFYAEHPVWLGASIPSALISGKIIAKEIISSYSK